MWIDEDIYPYTLALQHSFLQPTYQCILSALPCSQVIEGMDIGAHLEMTTLLINEGSSRCGIHHDPPAPLPALVAGPTGWRLSEQRGSHPHPNVVPEQYRDIAVSPPNSPHCPKPQWVQSQKGGRLFLLDGLWDLSYGPCDAVLLDGRYMHGVSVLRDMPLANRSSRRAELERFSLILFSKWHREKMKGEKRLRDGAMASWQHDWLPSVPWLSGYLQHVTPDTDMFTAAVLSMPRARKSVVRYQ